MNPSSHAAAQMPAGPAAPLCVDLDGTLLLSDSLVESIAALIIKRPLVALLLPFWLLRGKAAFKAAVARHVVLDPAHLPYNLGLLEYLRSERAAGRQIILVTAANQQIAHAIADHLDIFSDVIASDERLNLSGKRKSAALVERFGSGNFDYVGNSEVDLPVFSECRSALIAGSRCDAVARQAGRSGRAFDRSFRTPSASWKVWLKALRVHQWAKNALIFVPLITSHRIFEWPAFLAAVLAAAAFSLCASGVYIFNDLCDLDADRQSSRKRSRPFASGSIPLAYGFLLSPVLFGAGLLLCVLALNRLFLGYLALYCATTLFYTLFIKRWILLDAITLSGLYTVRVLAGGAATGIAISPWLLEFSMFTFLSLGMLKRVAELRFAAEGKTQRLQGRGYTASDRDVLHTLGCASGYVATLVLALYINGADNAALYRDPQWLWLLTPLQIYWISRLWMIEGRGQMNIDPVLFTITDKNSYVVAAAGAVFLLLAK